MMYELRDVGFSTAVGIGGRTRVSGQRTYDCMQAFKDDHRGRKKRIVMIGGDRGADEERAGP